MCVEEVSIEESDAFVWVGAGSMLVCAGAWKCVS